MGWERKKVLTKENQNGSYGFFKEKLKAFFCCFFRGDIHIYCKLFIVSLRETMKPESSFDQSSIKVRSKLG